MGLNMEISSVYVDILKNGLSVERCRYWGKLYIELFMKDKRGNTVVHILTPTVYDRFILDDWLDDW